MKGNSTMDSKNEQLLHWIDEHFEEEVHFLKRIVQVPSDTPPGNNKPHAETVSRILHEWGWEVEQHMVPTEQVQAYGMQSIMNLVVRRYYGPGPTIALNAHGDVVPPGEGWSYDPYSAHIEQGRLYGRAAAVSKSDFATYLYAVQAIESVLQPTKGSIELHFTYDEEFGGLLGPGWLLEQGIVKPDLVICASFSYTVIIGHNGCLQFEVTVNGKATHGAVPQTGHDALRAANCILTAIYKEADDLQHITSTVPGIQHPTMIVGQVSGGTNTNVVPGQVTLKLDRRMIPEENPTKVEAELRALLNKAVDGLDGINIDVRRILLANALRPLPGHEKLVNAIQSTAKIVLNETIPVQGTPLYADARLYAEHGIPVVMYGAGPRTLLESNAKRADEHLVLNDLRQATKVMALTLKELLE